MPLSTFTLTKKEKLTNNVYQLTFQTDQDFPYIYGQFITFILPKIGGRAYSVLEKNENTYELIIKKRELESGGRGGSKYICEKEVGDTLNGVKPGGNFILQNNNNNKLFIGTGTGFVPLYNQIIGSLTLQQDCKLKLIFGVRDDQDLFYIQQLNDLKSQYSNFDFEIYLSNQESDNYNKGYVTDYITQKNLNNYQEFYICGISAMIDSSVEKLKNNEIQEENIFTEKY